MARLAAAAGAAVAALIVIAIALWYLGQSLVLGLEAAAFGPATATLIAGLVGLVVAALLGLIGRAAVHTRAAARAPGPSGVGDVARQLGGLAAEQLVTATRAHPYGVMGTALLAGLAAGAVPELRTLLKDVLKG